MDTVKIEFTRPHFWKYIEPIVPAIKALPKWYKDMKPDIVGMKPSDRHNNGTVKACPAVFDGMTQGYIMPLWADLYVEPSEDVDNVPFFSWNPKIDGGGGAPLMQRFDVEVTQGMPHADKSQVPSFKINAPWIITTPPGYSTLFIAPLNNRDIMFETISGVIHTDVFTTFINLPFLWTGPADFKGIIKQETPLVQMIPFKREDFEYDIGFINPEQEEEREACAQASRTTFGGGYRQVFGQSERSR